MSSPKPYNVADLTVKQKEDIARIYEYADMQIAAGWKCCGKVLSLSPKHIHRIGQQADKHAAEIAEFGFCL